jgi:hypothetical protein
MRYRDGQPICVGDVVAIDRNHTGTVVGCIEEALYLPPHTTEQWGFLAHGVLIDTSFGGVVHYPDEGSMASETIVLVRRQQ